jgi:hypothetical protein
LELPAGRQDGELGGGEQEVGFRRHLHLGRAGFGRRRQGVTEPEPGPLQVWRQVEVGEAAAQGGRQDQWPRVDRAVGRQDFEQSH